MTIEISLLLSGVSVAFAIFFGICSKQRNEKKDTQEDAEQRATTDTMVMMKLENIADDLKDIKRESRENREEMKSLRDRVVIVEQSLKSYHKEDGQNNRRPLPLRRIGACTIRAVIRAYRQKRGRHPETGVVLVL